MAESPVLTSTFRVGKRTCTMSIPHPRSCAAVSMTVEWSPDVPNRLSKRELRQYRAGRDQANAELAAMIGGSIIVLEI